MDYSPGNDSAEEFAPTNVSIVRPVVGTAIVGGVATVIGGYVAGAEGVVGGLLGTAIVLGFFAVGQWLVGRVLRNNPALGLNVALMVYLGQVVVLFILLSVLKDATFFSPQVFAGTVVATALTWTAMIITSLSQRRVLYVEPESTLGLSDDPEVVERRQKEAP